MGAALLKLEEEEAAVKNLNREMDHTANICKVQGARLEHLKYTDDKNKTYREELTLVKGVMSNNETEVRTEQNNLALSKDQGDHAKVTIEKHRNN